MGISKSTVSVALRGKPGVSAERSEHIRQTAQAMGYRPNALIGIHMAQVRNSRAPRYQATLGWINNHTTQLLPGNYPQFFEALEGATSEAIRLGFNLEQFDLKKNNMTPKALVRILRARNIMGLIIAPQQQAGESLDLAWEHFSVVALGYSLRSPRLHVVTNCQRHTLQSALNHLRSFGYRRVGTIINEENNERVDRTWISTFWDDYHQQPPSSRLQPLLFHQMNQPLTAKMFVSWFKKEKPDAIIAEDYLSPVLEGLDYLRLKIGKDIALALRNAKTGDSTYAGTNQNARSVGIAATASVVAMLQRNERGIPAMPQQLLLESRWQSGRSVNEKGPAKSRACSK